MWSSWGDGLNNWHASLTVFYMNSFTSTVNVNNIGWWFSVNIFMLCFCHGRSIIIHQRQRGRLLLKWRSSSTQPQEERSDSLDRELWKLWNDLLNFQVLQWCGTSESTCCKLWMAQIKVESAVFSVCLVLWLRQLWMCPDIFIVSIREVRSPPRVLICLFIRITNRHCLDNS